MTDSFVQYSAADRIVTVSGDANCRTGGGFFGSWNAQCGVKVSRFDSSGAPDLSFGDAGSSSAMAPRGYNRARHVLFAADGNIIVAGTAGGGLAGDGKSTFMLISFEP